LDPADERRGVAQVDAHALGVGGDVLAVAHVDSVREPVELDLPALDPGPVAGDQLEPTSALDQRAVEQRSVAVGVRPRTRQAMPGQPGAALVEGLAWLFAAGILGPGLGLAQV